MHPNSDLVRELTAHFLVADVDPGAEVPPELRRPEIDGLSLVVEKRRYEPQ
ncbi:hypothetical protein AB0C81_19055 [Streptomyces roseoverticillatus]|uniref:hypothetical protein n=1 Tax=Streptomyces roseoverticillatus TaxID=66429 RepID=UPI0033C256CB